MLKIFLATTLFTSVAGSVMPSSNSVNSINFNNSINSIKVSNDNLTNKQKQLKLIFEALMSKKVYNEQITSTQLIQPYNPSTRISPVPIPG